MLPVIEPSRLRRGPDWGSDCGSDWGSVAAGYAHPDYPRALAAFGQPVALARSRAWVLARPVPGSPLRDAIGPYPFLSPARTPAQGDDPAADLAADLEDLGRGVLCLGAVPDPFAWPDPAPLRAAFDRVQPYKSQYVADLEIPFASYMRRHHRRYAGRARDAVDVMLAPDPASHAAEWAALYQVLVARHAITGLRAFSDRSHALQLAVPGCHYFRALRDGVAVGGLICYLDRGVAYAHLVSTTPEGQALLAQYALYWHAIEHFRGIARWFLLGAVPDGTGGAGLATFKAGWATGTCPSHFCSRIFDQGAYAALCAQRPAVDSQHFPAYRQGRF